PPVELLRPELPKGIDSLLEKALAAAPERRYQDAGRMYESLLSYLYASGDRFGANDLSLFAGRFRNKPSSRPPSLQPDSMADETLSTSDDVADDQTPIEIPTQSQ